MDRDNGRWEEQHGTLRLEVLQEDSGHIVALRGELDLASAPALVSALEKIETAGPGDLTLDLSELEFIDSTGIAILVQTHHRFDGSGRLRLLPSKASAVRRVLSLTGLDSQLPFSPDGEVTGRAQPDS